MFKGNPYFWGSIDLHRQLDRQPDIYIRNEDTNWGHFGSRISHSATRLLCAGLCRPYVNLKVGLWSGGTAFSGSTESTPPPPSTGILGSSANPSVSGHLWIPLNVLPGSLTSPSAAISELCVTHHDVPLSENLHSDTGQVLCQMWTCVGDVGPHFKLRQV